MKGAFTSVMKRFAHGSWAGINARLRIVASDDESAYFAWVDEYLDRLHAETAASRPAAARSAKASTIDDIASA